MKKDFVEIEQLSLSILATLGYNVVEIENWYCCGGFPAITQLDHAKYLGAVRTLSIASKQSKKLGLNTVLTFCPFCYNVLKRASRIPEAEFAIYERVAKYLSDDVEPYVGGLQIAHLVEILALKTEDLKKLVKRSLNGLKIAAYYGCMLLRPRSIAIDSPENPQIIEKILEVLGAEPVDFPHKTYCCGAFHGLAYPEIASYNTSKIVKSAVESGATIITTPCPLCYYNLRLYSKELRTDIKVLHISEIVAQAIGIKDVGL